MDLQDTEGTSDNESEDNSCTSFGSRPRSLRVGNDPPPSFRQQQQQHPRKIMRIGASGASKTKLQRQISPISTSKQVDQ
jgi:hypothetical protein